MPSPMLWRSSLLDNFAKEFENEEAGKRTSTSPKTRLLLTLSLTTNTAPGMACNYMYEIGASTECKLMRRRKRPLNSRAGTIS